MLSCTNYFNVTFYFLGRGSFNGISDSETIHLGWGFFIDQNNNKFYGKIIEDTYGYFITENELYESQRFQREFINSAGRAVSDNTIIQQINPQYLICNKLTGGNFDMDSFNIYYFSREKLYQNQINEIARKWEAPLQDYING
ncbi:MAG: hypothetical protein MJH09_12735 [Cetobacterium sp.]|nr:hypothetical protein [Cetobacterium sp.]